MGWARGVVVLALIAAGCGDDVGEDAGVDGGGRDAGPAGMDAGPPAGDAGPGVDAGEDDGGAVDAGTADAGTADAGTADAGTVDAGTTDAGAADGGPPDAGPSAGKVVFVTDLPAFEGNLGGLAGADTTCTMRANAAGIPGTFMAWLSTDASSPSTRFTRSTVPYVLPDGTVVANDWADLVDGTLAARINVTENMATLGGGANVWTRTEADGTPRATFDCSDWTANSGFGIIGNILYTDARWTALGAMDCGLNVFRLYCFEQ